MIEINKNSQLIRELLSKFYTHIEHFFKIHPGNQNPRNAKDKSKLQLVFERNSGTLYGDMFQYFLNHLKEIITAEPEELKSKQENMLSAVGYDSTDKSHQDDFLRFKNSMFNYYTNFFQTPINENNECISIGRWLTKSLDLNVCPYCNHNYTLTVNDRKRKIIVKPDFDHFFSKTKNPLLALSFFNLIPICTTCNKLKGEKELFQNPYDGAHPRPKFKLYGINKDKEMALLGLGDAFDEIQIFPEAAYSSANPNTCNVTKLGLKQIYDQHIDHVSDLILKAQQYNMGSYSAMIESFQGLGKTEGDIDRIIWDRYRDDNSKRPLSKLTSDILEQFGF